MYKSFILPHFDYADVIWDNCTEEQANSLENLHLEALRIIVGAIRGTSHQKLYEESGFCPLKERRKRHKIVYYYNLKWSMVYVQIICRSLFQILCQKITHTTGADPSNVKH
mgnify:CR=1 FL=1